MRLEEAIRKVEAEAARESLGLGAPAVKSRNHLQNRQPEPNAPAVADAVSTSGRAAALGTATRRPNPAAVSPMEDRNSGRQLEPATPSPLKETLV